MPDVGERAFPTTLTLDMSILHATNLDAAALYAAMLVEAPGVNVEYEPDLERSAAIVGLSRRSSYRRLTDLHNAGLVMVNRPIGSSRYLVRILPRQWAKRSKPKQGLKQARAAYDRGQTS